MVREIHLTEIKECKDKDYLGKFIGEEDYDELIDYDCDVYTPEGTLVLCFRKQAIKSILDMEERDWEYWKWASTHSGSVNRGDAGGTDLINDKGNRFTTGEYLFLSRAKKGQYDDATVEECMNFVYSRPEWNVWSYAPKWVREDGLFDNDRVDILEATYKSNKTQANLDALVDERSKWFRNWVETRFVTAEDRQEEAKRAWKLYSGAQSWNYTASNVLGALDRQALVPWARLTGTTMADFEGFERQAPFFHEVDDLFKRLMPENHSYLYGEFQKVADPVYNLFDTAFTSVTVNRDFRVACHRDKLNCPGGIAAITVMDEGTYEGFEFIFPQFRIAFEIRHGDFLVGDNQGFLHAMGEMRNPSPGATSVWQVFYSKSRLRYVDNLECEMCRKEFKKYSRANLQYRGNGKPSWGGVYQKMWSSPEWNEYKSEHCPEASNTNWCCTEDK